MFAAGKTAAVSGAGPDDKFNYVTMLLHGDGTNGAQNNTFLDSSTNNFTITRNGNTTQGSFSPYGSNWSNYFNGDPTRLSLATATALGTGNVTVEFWFNTPDTSATYYALYEGRSAVSSNTGLGIFQYGQTIEIYGNGLKVSSAASAFTANTWTHFAVVRTSGTCQIYINGVASGSSASYSDNFTSTTRRIGQNAAGLNTYTGYISNVREVTSALYSGTFTPSTTPLTAVSGTTLLTCQSNRFIDNSTNAYAITVTGTPSVQRFNPFGTSTAYSTSVIGGSGYFDGSGDYLSVAASSAFNFGTGDYTIEGWIYSTSNTWTLYDTGGGGSIDQFVCDGGTLYWGYGDGSPPQYGVPDFFTSSDLNQWVHVAVSRSGTTQRCFKNGVVMNTLTTSSSYGSSTTPPKIGRRNDGSYSTNGYLSNIRVVKGTALYTSAFTPPTAPLTAVSGTSLLTSMTNGAIYDNAMMNDLETVGNAQISTSVKKYGTGSLAFDGTGDYLKNNLNPTVGDLGSGDFTIECWLRVNTTDAFDFFGTGTWAYYMSSGQSGWAVSQASNKVSFSYQVNRSWITATNFVGTDLSVDTWYHIAIVRSGGVIKCYFNGTASSTTISTSANIVSTTYGLIVGGGAGAIISDTYCMNGYLDDLRITKGYARYTANFTPPTAAFSNTGPI